MTRLFASLSASILLALMMPASLLAHPMGNFSINHYAAIRLAASNIEIRYLIDMAEIPTFQEMQETGMPARVGDPAVSKYVVREQEVLKTGLSLELNGRKLRLRSLSREVIFPPGAGGLPTMKMGFLFRAALDDLHRPTDMRLRYRDSNFPDRAGWKEIVASALEGIKLTGSSVPAKDRSLELTDYPTGTLNSPPQDLSAQMDFVVVPAVQRRLAGVPAASTPERTLPFKAAAATQAQTGKASETLSANRQGTPRNAFTELVSKREWSFWFLFTAALIAAGLGAFHALEPGHGKTIVAAYLVGSQGTAMHACLLGLIVTASHTAGVYLLGAVTLYASRYVVPERLYPWLGAISGLTIAGLGIYLFVQRLRGKHSHAHPHGHVHPHEHHHNHEHSHSHAHHHQHPHSHAPRDGPGKVSRRQLLALGITGGIVPCPAALVVLLSAVALHRIAFGLFLILAFSIGLAAVLIAIGLLMVYARRFMSRVSGEGRVITRWLPITSAVFITFLGFAIALRALATAGLVTLPL